MSTERRRDRPDERETSYGGVVVRGAETIVITPTGKTVIGLPKGGARQGETAEQTAAREVREETGVEVSVRERLGDIRYWYRRGGKRILKTVHFYLCDYVAGDTADHDHEVDEARWMPLAEAATALSFPGEREMIERALSKIAANG
jgi:8-oxo-dGTP pyrophosphatase MutT (NUDIX family)